ncbi:MAG: alpha-E domain-containing protein [Synergistaceae bacterium]|nr:alpha-E domain-containing protein [Synergistaceae bacterium]
MAILSCANSGRLFWLGRYTERVFTGIRALSGRSGAWAEAESKLCFDGKNPESLYCSLMYAYDNAIVLRDEIGSDTFSYIQMAVYEMNSARKSPAPMLQLQKVNDNIAAFWGMADDAISDENVRGIIKLGKRIERVDLYARGDAGNDEIRREVTRLTYRIEKTGLHYDPETLSALNELAEAEDIDRPEMIRKVESLVDFP